MQNILVDELVGFYKGYGVILDCYIVVFKSEVVDVKVKGVCVFVLCVKVMGILILIVNGKYCVKGDLFELMLCNVDVLIVCVCSEKVC